MTQNERLLKDLPSWRLCPEEDDERIKVYVKACADACGLSYAGSMSEMAMHHAKIALSFYLHRQHFSIRSHIVYVMRLLKYISWPEFCTCSKH